MESRRGGLGLGTGLTAVLWQPPECHPSACLDLTSSLYNNLYCWSSGRSARAYFFVSSLEGFGKCANIWTDTRWFPFWATSLCRSRVYLHKCMATWLWWVTTTGGDNEEIVGLENSGKLSVRSVIANTHLTGGRACLSQSAVWVGYKRN